jgi:uncharacterized protein (DUF1684 family)
MGKHSKHPKSGCNKKTYRIFSKRRFATFLLILCASVFLAGFAFAEKPVRAAEAPKYTEVEVHAGDTLWQIASKYKDGDQDIRSFIYDICKLNGVSADNLRAGDMILVPTRTD